MDNNLLTSDKQTLIQHFSELKRRILYSILAFMAAFTLSYYNAEIIYKFLLNPLVDAFSGSERKVIYTALTEAFFTYIKLSCFSAFIISFPFIVGQIYIFIAPALYKSEKKVLFPYLIAAPILFIMGGTLVYKYVFPVAWKFFLSFEKVASNGTLAIQLEAKVSEYLSLVMHLIIAFGIAFQMPILLTLMARVGLINAEFLVAKRKIAIILIFCIAAVITPPDVISQIGLAIPMLILYELSIIACKYIEKPKVKYA
jgi:sec-independent protein translocase protein TatC